MLPSARLGCCRAHTNRPKCVWHVFAAVWHVQSEGACGLARRAHHPHYSWQPPSPLLATALATLGDRPRHSWQYFSSAWNRFDFALVLAALLQHIHFLFDFLLDSMDSEQLPFALAFRVIRLFRVGRVFRLLKFKGATEVGR